LLGQVSPGDEEEVLEHDRFAANCVPRL
jgi:hypothetical protein